MENGEKTYEVNKDQNKLLVKIFRGFIFRRKVVETNQLLVKAHSVRDKQIIEAVIGGDSVKLHKLLS